MGGSKLDKRLSLYTILWGSALWSRTGRKIPWRDPSPRVVAEAAAFTIWSYVQGLQDQWWTVLLQVDKPSVIGHAALLARMDGHDTLLFSSIGGNVGFYGVTDRRHLAHYPPTSGVLVSCQFAESLAGHLETGKWELLADFAGRIVERGRPRVQRNDLSGAEAEHTYGLLADIRRQTRRRWSGPGAPRHFGLDTKAVRVVSDLARPLPMRAYQFRSRPPSRFDWLDILADLVPRAGPSAVATAYMPTPQSPVAEIPGGCANAVASILGAAGLGHLVPPEARFELTLSLDEFKDAVLPVLVGDDAFSTDGRAQDPDLVAALDRLPHAWGASTRLAFTDPSYWIETVPENDDLTAELMRIMARHII
jgi:hypothetical protein